MGNFNQVGVKHKCRSRGSVTQTGRSAMIRVRVFPQLKSPCFLAVWTKLRLINSQKVTELSCHNLIRARIYCAFARADFV